MKELKSNDLQISGLIARVTLYFYYNAPTRQGAQVVKNT